MAISFSVGARPPLGSSNSLSANNHGQGHGELLGLGLSVPGIHEAEVI